LQASILVDNRLSAESTQLPEGGFWETNLGRFSTAESIPVVIEAYCYRENQPVGFIKVEANVAVDRFPAADVYVSPPSVANPEQPCYTNEYNEYRIIESVAPIPCIGANWQPYE
jgi:hypothetical protein